MSTIHLRGPWLWTWVVWGVVRTVLLFVGAYVGHWHGLTQEVHLALLGWYTLFLVLELVGAWRLGYNPPGVEIAKTWSQVQQRLARQGRWEASVALCSAVLDCVALAIILSPLSPWLAATASLVFAYRYLVHIAYRMEWG